MGYSLGSRSDARLLFEEPGGRAIRSNPMSLITLPPGSPGKFCWRVKENHRIQVARSEAMSLGGGDEGLEGDMGLSKTGR